MFFKHLDTISELPLGSRVYSIALVQSLLEPNSYRIHFRNTCLILISSEVMHPGDWIRFIGTYDGKVIHSEMIENLNGIDINIVVKCLDKLLSEYVE